MHSRCLRRFGTPPTASRNDAADEEDEEDEEEEKKEDDARGTACGLEEEVAPDVAGDATKTV